MPYESVEMHPNDAKKLGVRTGDWVKVRSRRGEVRARAKATKMSPEGTVFMSFSFPEETQTNLVTNPKYDPKTETPEVKVAAVAIEKA